MLLPPIILTINLITEINHKPNKQQPSTLREKCPNTELSNLIRRDTGKYGPEKAMYLDTFQAVVEVERNYQKSKTT